MQRLEDAAALGGDPTVAHLVDTDERAAELARTFDNRSRHLIRRSYTDEIRLQDIVGNFSGLLLEIDRRGLRIPTRIELAARCRW